MNLTEIKNVLINEYSALEELQRILVKQQEMTLKSDAFSLDSLVKEIRNKSVDVAKYESERRKLTGNQSIKDIVDNSNDGELIEIYDKISVLVDKIVLQKETNDLLIKQSLIFVNKMLKLLNPNKEVKVYNSYGKMTR